MHVKLAERQTPKKTGRQTIFTMYLQHVQWIWYTCDFLRLNMQSKHIYRSAGAAVTM